MVFHIFSILVSIIYTISLFLNLYICPYLTEEEAETKQWSSLHSLDSVALLLVFVSAWSGSVFRFFPNCQRDSWMCFALVVTVVVANGLFLLYCLIMYFLVARNSKVILKGHLFSNTVQLNFFKQNTRAAIVRGMAVYDKSLKKCPTIENPLYKEKRGSISI